MRLADVVEAPVELGNHIFNITADLAAPGNTRYERYRSGIYRAEAGVLLFGGGLAAMAVGVEGSGTAALLGLVMTYEEGARAMWHALQIDEQNM